MITSGSANTISAEYSGGPEVHRDVGCQRSQECQADHAEGARDERGDRRDPECLDQRDPVWPSRSRRYR